MNKAIRWMFLGCFLALVAIWCIVFGISLEGTGGRFVTALFMLAILVLPILSVICFAVGFFHRGE